MARKAMAKNRRRIAGVGAIIVGLACLGCSDEVAPEPTEPGKLSPGMEKMKAEMLKAYQTKSLGKDPNSPTGKK